MSDRMRPKIQIVDGVSEGEGGYELHVKNREQMRAQEEITDDNVYKELINIVMDVFSNKSENCVLTFELPAESNVVKEITQLTVENVLKGSYASKSGILIPLKGSKRSKKSLLRKKRKRKVPTAKSSKYKIQKKHKKRLHSVVQTALQPKPGCIDLERLLRMQPQQSQWSFGRRYPSLIRRPAGGREQEGGVKLSVDSEIVSRRSDARGWRDSPERGPLLDEVPSTRNETRPVQRNADTKQFGNLCREIKNVLDDLEGLTQEQTGKLSLAELSYHLEGIQCHMEVMKKSLQALSLDPTHTPQLTSTEGSEAPKRNKVGIKLIRVGAKIGGKSKNATSLKKKKKGKINKNRSSKDVGLEDILEKYHRVKEEETEIVKVLLGRLRTRKDRLQNDEQQLRRLKRGVRGAKCTDISQACDAAVEETQVERITRNTQDDLDLDLPSARMRIGDQQNFGDLDELTNQVKRNATQNDISQTKPEQSEYKMYNERPNDNQNGTRITRPKDPKLIDQTRQIVSKGDLKDTIRKTHSPIILYEYPSTVSSGKSEAIIGKYSKGKTKKSRVSRETTKGGKMMLQIESAAKRLEYMQTLVEKKLDHLSKQQKELNRKIGGKRVGNDTRESRSNVPELRNAAAAKLSTETEELCCHQLGNGKYDEEQNISGKSKFDDEPDGAEKEPTDAELVESSLRTVETQGITEGPVASQNYICNFMTEQPERGLELATAEPLENQRGSGNVSSTVLANEFQEVPGAESSSGRIDPPKKIEGEIIEESLYSRPNSFRRSVPTSGTRKKKKKIIHAPSCVLS